MKRLLSCLALLAFLTTGCSKKKSETTLLQNFRSMDSLLRGTSWPYDSMKMFEARMAENFLHSTTRELRYEGRSATVNYRWNADSSLVLLSAHKVFPTGFSREVILHSGDSILFVDRFSTEPLGLDDPEKFSFLEEILYVTPEGTIAHLARIAYRQSDLADTIAFRRKPFANLTDKISFYYSLELNHSRNILSLN